MGAPRKSGRFDTKPGKATSRFFSGHGFSAPLRSALSLIGPVTLPQRWLATDDFAHPDEASRGLPSGGSAGRGRESDRGGGFDEALGSGAARAHHRAAACPRRRTGAIGKRWRCFLRGRASWVSWPARFRLHSHVRPATTWPPACSVTAVVRLP